MRQILVIDDEPDVADLLAINVRKLGKFTVSVACDGVSGLRRVREEPPSLIVLDLMLPGMSGLEVCHALKSNPATERIPIVVLTAKAEASDRIRAFELGADDYVTKPFSPGEVVLRINAIARYSEGAVGEHEWTAGDISVSAANHEVLVQGKRVHLTAIEFKLLSYLIRTRGRIQSRDQLLGQVWDYSSSITTRTVDTHIVRLRQKLGKGGVAIETVRTYGYRFRNQGCGRL